MNRNADPGTTSSLAPELVELLTEFARAVQRYAMYPSGHPARTATVEQLLSALTPRLATRSRIQLGISRDQISIAGAATDPGSALLRNFAERLSDHQLSSLAISAGVTAGELAGFLEIVSLQAGRACEPLGASPPATLKQWPHLELVPVTYEGISISRAQAAGRTAVEPPPTAAPGTGTGEDQTGGTGERGGITGDFDPGASVTAAAEGLTVDGFPALTAVLQGGEADPETIRREVSRLILSLDPRTLGRLTEALPSELQAGGLEGAITQAVTSFIASAGGESGDEHSAQLLRIMTKLGMGKDSPTGADDPETVQTLSDLVSRLGTEWKVEDSSPEDYREQLRSFSQQAPILSIISTWMQEPTSDRVVQMGLELNQISPPVHYAATCMVRDGQLQDLLDILETAPASADSVDDLWTDVLTPSTILGLVEPEPPDFPLLDRLLPRLSRETLEPLFEVLADGRPDETRGGIMERLVQMPELTGPMAVERLLEERGALRRNMLILIGRLPAMPEGFSPVSFLVDIDPGVRREAVRLALQHPEEREIALASALSDSNEKIVLMGLAAVFEGCPPEVVPSITALIRSPKSPASLRLAAIRALTGSDAPETLDFLIKMTWQPRFLFFKGLAPKSADMLEALAVLARIWSDHAPARKVLSAARKSKDPQIRAIVTRAEAGR